MFDTGIIINTLKSEAIPTGDLKLLYDWNHASGEIIFNEVYNTGQHFVESLAQNQQSMVESVYPGISIGHTNRPVTSKRDSSGYFRFTDMVQASRAMTEDNWTFFLNYKSDWKFSGNSCLMLLSTKDSYSGTSGFSVGVNASNRLFFEYPNVEGENIIFTHFKELGDQNVISVSKGLGKIELSYYDLSDGVNYHQGFSLSGFVKSQDWYIGHFYDQGNPKDGGNPYGSLDNGLLTDARYTGFSGWIDEFVFFNGAMSKTTKEQICSGSVYTSVTSGITSGNDVLSRKVTGVTVNPTGVTGYGQTGVSYGTFFRIYPKCGPYVDIYIPTEQSGSLTGELISYLTGTEMVTGVEIVTEPGARIVNYSTVSNYAKKNICFSNIIAKSSDRVEVYSSDVNESNKSQTASFKPGETTIQEPDKTWEPERVTLPGSYLLDTGFSGENLSIYSNGLLVPAKEYAATASDYKVKFSDSSFDHTNTIIYHRSVGAEKYLSYSGDVPKVTITGSDYFNKDIYLRPTGEIGATKLISGIDYDSVGSQLEIYSSNSFIKNLVGGSNNSGEFIFVSKRRGEDSQSFDSGVGFIKNAYSMQDEAVWVNGRRQTKEQYSVVTDKSLLLTNQFLTGYNTVLFDNYDTFWNDSGVY
jgi:hypothetical protein